MYVDYINMIHTFLTNDLFWNSFRFYRRIVKRAQIYLIYMCVCVSHSVVQLIVTPWTVAHQAALSTGFSRQGYCSGLPFHSRGSSWPRGWTRISHISGRFFTTWATREAPYICVCVCVCVCVYNFQRSRIGHIYIHTHVYVHIYIYDYTHRHIYEYSLGPFTTLP